MQNYLLALLYGIVEGITEWLPISSTGHMILLDAFVALNVTPEFWNFFLVVVQFGAILAVILLYFKTLWPVKKVQHRRRTKLVIDKDTLLLYAKILIACIPAGVVGVLFDDWLDEHLYNWMVVSGALIIVGIAFIVVEILSKNREAAITELRDLTFLQAFLIGLFQLVAAVFPGTSRSGATIIGALLLGVARPVAAEFTFILAIPVMAGASLLKLVKYGFVFTAEELIILAIGMVSAFVVSILVIKLLMNYIRKNDFKIFGIYRILLGVMVIVFFALRG